MSNNNSDSDSWEESTKTLCDFCGESADCECSAASGGAAAASVSYHRVPGESEEVAIPKEEAIPAQVTDPPNASLGVSSSTSSLPKLWTTRSPSSSRLKKKKKKRKSAPLGKGRFSETDYPSLDGGSSTPKHSPSADAWEAFAPSSPAVDSSPHAEKVESAKEWDETSEEEESELLPISYYENAVGTSPLVGCGACKKVFQVTPTRYCPQCNSELHGTSDFLNCVSCNYKEVRKIRCPFCDGDDLFGGFPDSISGRKQFRSLLKTHRAEKSRQHTVSYPFSNRDVAADLALFARHEGDVAAFARRAELSTLSEEVKKNVDIFAALVRSKNGVVPALVLFEEWLKHFELGIFNNRDKIFLQYFSASKMSVLSLSGTPYGKQHSENSFTCDYCSSVFFGKNAFHAHMRDKHRTAVGTGSLRIQPNPKNMLKHLGQLRPPGQMFKVIKSNLHAFAPLTTAFNTLSNSQREQFRGNNDPIRGRAPRAPQSYSFRNEWLILQSNAYTGAIAAVSEPDLSIKQAFQAVYDACRSADSRRDSSLPAEASVKVAQKKLSTLKKVLIAKLKPHGFASQSRSKPKSARNKRRNRNVEKAIDDAIREGQLSGLAEAVSAGAGFDVQPSDILRRRNQDKAREAIIKAAAYGGMSLDDAERLRDSRIENARKRGYQMGEVQFGELMAAWTRAIAKFLKTARTIPYESLGRKDSMGYAEKFAARKQYLKATVAPIRDRAFWAYKAKTANQFFALPTNYEAVAAAWDNYQSSLISAHENAGFIMQHPRSWKPKKKKEETPDRPATVEEDTEVGSGRRARRTVKAKMQKKATSKIVASLKTAEREAKRQQKPKPKPGKRRTASAAEVEANILNVYSVLASDDDDYVPQTTTNYKTVKGPDGSTQFVREVKPVPERGLNVKGRAPWKRQQSWAAGPRTGGRGGFGRGRGGRGRGRGRGRGGGRGSSRGAGKRNARERSAVKRSGVATTGMKSGLKAAAFMSAVGGAASLGTSQRAGPLWPLLLVLIWWPKLIFFIPLVMAAEVVWSTTGVTYETASFASMTFLPSGTIGCESTFCNFSSEFAEKHGCADLYLQYDGYGYTDRYCPWGVSIMTSDAWQFSTLYGLAKGKIVYTDYDGSLSFFIWCVALILLGLLVFYSLRLRHFLKFVLYGLFIWLFRLMYWPFRACKKKPARKCELDDDVFSRYIEALPAYERNLVASALKSPPPELRVVFGPRQGVVLPATFNFRSCDFTSVAFCDTISESLENVQEGSKVAVFTRMSPGFDFLLALRSVEEAGPEHIIRL